MCGLYTDNWHLHHHHYTGQIKFLLGHASVLTSARYLGCKQNFEEPVNDRFGMSVIKEPRFTLRPVLAK